MEGRAREIRKQAANCIRLFLSGKVSWDHLIEEFKSSEDSDTRDVIKLIEEATAGINKYERLDGSQSNLKESMEKLIKRLEAQ